MARVRSNDGTGSAVRIALVSTVYKQTPPIGYGGIERVVHTLGEELVSRGHHVTLFATPGSKSSGELIEIEGYDPGSAPSGLAGGAPALSEEGLYRAMVDRLAQHPVDVIHDFSFDNLYTTRHPDRVPFVTSVCVPVDAAFDRPNIVACSRAHAATIGPTTRFVRYGLDLSSFPTRFEKQDHLVHIAKIAPYKAQHEAILAAALAGRDIQIVGNVEHQLYHRLAVAPLARLLPRASYLGETQSTRDLLLPAAALIQTPRWFDALPLIVLEAMACGTPVIAYAQGGLPEEIEHGVNGFLCDGFTDLVHAIRRVGEIDPRACRAHAERHFTAARMADEYCDLYAQVIDGVCW